MSTRDAAERWVAGWSRAWPARDESVVAALYDSGARFHSQPFREHQDPGAYATWVFGEQHAVDFRFGTPIVAGDRAAVDWWAAITAPDGSIETIAGISLLRFSADGSVLEQRDAWNSAPGRVELATWAV